MISAEEFIEPAKRLGFSLWTGVPCSYLQPFINYVMADRSLLYAPASNEGDAVSISAGVEIGGGRAVTMFQNSGLTNAVSPLTSLTYTHRIPVLLITTLRGEPGEVLDEPQHHLMGAITRNLLNLMEIAWEVFPTDATDVESCLNRAMAHMAEEGRPYCLAMRKGSVSPVPAPPPLERRQAGAVTYKKLGTISATRKAMLSAVQAATGPSDVVLATTGYTGRELFSLGDRDNQLYLVGAMGCASSVGLGLALQRPDLRVVVLDGDGAALMRFGALAAIGYQRPSNLVHIVLDNGLHESTGGQPTVSGSVDFAAIAAACGYPSSRVVDEPAELAEILLSPLTELTFIRAMVAPGFPEELARPTVAPDAVTNRLRGHLRRFHGRPSSGGQPP